MSRKKAILSGGEIGMGRGIALVLAENGYDIAFSYYPNTQNLEDALNTTTKLLEARGARSWAFPADFSMADAPREFFEKAVDAIGGVDLLVNNAGVNIPLPLQDITEKNFDYLVSIDLRAYVMLMHYAAKYMIDHEIQGCIVNISSSRGERAYANAGIYCGIKACLNHMAEAFALDLAGLLLQRGFQEKSPAGDRSGFLGPPRAANSAGPGGNTGGYRQSGRVSRI